MALDPRDPLNRPVGRLLRLAQVTRPDDIVGVLALSVAEIDGYDLALYLVDYEYLRLVPYPASANFAEPVGIEGSMAGRAFLSSQPLAAERDGTWTAWIPVTDRSERLGVLAMRLRDWDDQLEEYCVELGFAAAYLLLSSSQYTDGPQILRRRKDMSLAAEIQWGLLPPLSLSVEGAAVAGLLEPAYDVAGDCFDYALNGANLDLAAFDAMGHGLSSSLLATLAVGAYRNARRGGCEVDEIVSEVDETVGAFHAGESFVTAVIARFNVTTGRVRWISAGHSAPLHVRQGKTLPEAGFSPSLPLGLSAIDRSAESREAIETSLEPGDALLLYTDGVVDSRSPDGTPFGEARLRDLLERESVSGREPNEVLRRLVHAAKTHHGGRLRDDASMVLLHWDGHQPAT